MNPRHGATRLRLEKAKILDRIRNLEPGLAVSIDEVLAQLDWYKIKNLANDPDTTEVYIYDEIGGYCGLNAETFVQELNAITTPNITVRINSPGGSLFDGIAIYNSLVSHPAYITGEVDALAASAASIILMGADKVRMKVGSQLMMHDAMGVEMGNAQQMRDMSDFLERQSDNIATIYAERAGGEPSDWRTKMLAETWYFANEAVDAGLADEVYKRPSSDDAEEAVETDDSAVEEAQEPESQNESENSEDDVLEFLMKAPHRLTNRGYKYTGRRRAPGPENSHKRTGPIGLLNSGAGDELTEKFLAYFKK
jgi:ATP-dependent protease ClpP protease subunit